MIGIYKIINPKGKVYIGQSINIEKRWKKDYQKLNCKGQIQLYNSLIKYGLENHQFEIIEECTLEELDFKETYWKTIQVNDKGWENVLFNSLIDGKGGSKKPSTKLKMSISSQTQQRQINVYDLKGNFVSTFNNPTEAKNILLPDIKDTTGGIIQSCNQSRQKTYRGYIFQYSDNDNIKEIINNLNKNVKIKQKKVIQYNLQDIIIKEYENSYQAEKQLRTEGINIHSTDIRACCNGKQKTACGFKWKYGEELINHAFIKHDLEYIENKKIEYNNIANEVSFQKEIRNQNPKKELHEWLKNNIKENIKLNHKKEIQFFIPELNIGINLIDLYQSTKLPKNHFKDIHKKYTQQNIKIINIYSDEFILKKQIVISRLENEFHLNKNRIYARKCVIKEVNIKEKNKFLQNNHIQGKDTSLYKIGLYYEDELVSLMTFKRPRNSIGKTKNIKENSWELIRFCNKINTTIIGSASKLLKHFLKTYKPNHIYSFADNRWSSPINNIYLKIGFQYVSSSQHGYYYTNDFINRLHRFNFNKGKLKEMGLDTTNNTEYELMLKLGYHRIWDCGVTRFELIR